MLDRLIRQREYLLDISRTLTEQLHVSDVLRETLHSATDMLGGQAGLIALADQTDDTFTVRASYGIPAKLLHFFKPLLSDITRQDPESFSIPELDEKMRLVAKAAGMGLHQVIALPMTIRAEMIGVVYIFRAHRSAFSRNDTSLLQSFANQAAIAVQNARLYEQILNEKQRLDAILRHSADGIMILHNDQTVESINLALARMTGIRVEDVENAQHDDVIRWEGRELGMELPEAIAGGWPLHEHSVLYVEGDLQHISGSTLSVGITYAPLFDRQGQFRNIIANVRDITRFREAEEAKDTFISVISHELKTPVSLVKGYASTLLRDDVEWDQDVVKNGLIVIEEEADRLSELIENLLDVSRLHVGTLTLNFATVNICALAEQTVDKFRTQTEKHAIKSDFPEDMSTVQADERRLGQVLDNLVSNAIKYSPEGGEIVIGGRELEKHIEVYVSDEGIGITPAQQERIFERFYRVDNAMTRQTQGVGLGLYIVRSLVEAHGGSIRAESESGKGASFIFTLPLSQGSGA